MFRLFIIFSTVINIALGAALNIQSASSAISSAANGNQCTDKPTWVGSGSTSIDCIGAVQKLHDAEVKHFSDFDFEFLSEKAPARSLPSMRTPRKYTVGEYHNVSCRALGS